MSISRLQYNNKKEEFIQELLRKGIEPNNYELNKMLSEFFDNKTLGMPYYAPIKQEAYEVSNREAYNYNFDSLRQDLDIMYQANIESNNKSVAIQEYYDTEKTKVINAIQKLNLRTQNIEDIINSSITGKQYVQVFDDLYDVEYYGNSDRNIPFTSSFVDLLQKKVYTEKSNSKINKLNITEASVDVTAYNYTTTGDISSILTDTLDSFYIVTVNSEEDGSNSISISIDLGTTMDINTVLMSFNTSREMTCSLSVSDDGVNYINVHDLSGTSLVEWNFPTKSIQYLNITLNKEVADGKNINNTIETYEYYYIIKNISVANEEFESKSVFVSKPIEFNDLVNSIRLDATDMIYNNTRIDYFIGFDNGASKVGWDAITNHKDHELFMFEKKYKICNFSLRSTKDFGSQDPEADKLYRIYEIDSTINQNSIKVTPGYNMWSVKQYQKSSGQSYDTSFTFKSLDFTDYTDQCTEVQGFLDCEAYMSYILNPNTLYVFTQYVQCSEPSYLYNRYLRIMDSTSSTILTSAEQKIFINGLEVSKIGNDGENYYSFNLKKGVNKVQIVVYAPSVNGANIIRWLNHNINFREITNDVFAFPPMKYVNWYVLDKHMKENYNYYTIKDNYICVKCTPEDMIKGELQDMGYFLSYYSLKPDMRYYFNNNTIKFRIMAILHSNNKDVSPELINFRITGK